MVAIYGFRILTYVRIVRRFVEVLANIARVVGQIWIWGGYAS